MLTSVSGAALDTAWVSLLCSWPRAEESVHDIEFASEWVKERKKSENKEATPSCYCSPESVQYAKAEMNETSPVV